MEYLCTPKGTKITDEPFWFIARGTTRISGKDYIRVLRSNYKMNYINLKGKFLLADDYTNIELYDINNTIQVSERNLTNFAKTTDGKLLFTKWFKRTEYISDHDTEKVFKNYRKVQLRNGKWNIATFNGKYILDKWLNDKPTDRECNNLIKSYEKTKKTR